VKARPILLILVLIPIQAMAASPTIVLKLKEDVEIAGPEVFLRDIADIEAEGVQKDLVEKVEGLRIGASPPPYLSRRIDASYISLKLRSIGMDGSEFRILGDHVNVKRKGRTVKGDEIADVARAALSHKEKGDKGFVEIISKPPDFRIPEGKVEIRAREGGIRTGAGGISFVPVELIVDGRTVAMVQVLARMDEECEVLVLTRNVARNEGIGEGDIKRAKARRSSLPPECLGSPSDLSGMRAKRNLRAGEILTRDMVEPIPVIKKGDRITITVRFGGVRISAQGTAQEDGVLGDRIRVKRDGSQKDLICVVMGKGQAFVAVGGE
jgi:flagella basal body P-ring formation protein FlgA